MNEEIRNRLIVIGERLRKARESLGYTQEEASEKINIGRPRYSDIENGKRNVPLKELYRFCEFYGRPLEYFLKETLALDNGFKVLFRKTEGDQEVAKVIAEFENLCERMRELEEIMEIRIKPPVPPDYEYEKSREWFWGKHYADQERKKLDLGQAPISNLHQILEEKCGLKIFYLPIPEEKEIFGMFTFDEKIGGCILINTNPTVGNQLFSLAHEYAHFVFHKKKLGIISFKKEEDTLDERLANCFASNFLMPEDAVKDIYNVRIKNRKDIAAEDVFYFSHYFGVSFKAMVFRLNNLKLLNDELKNKLVTETCVTAVRRVMGISEPEISKSRFPPLYEHLCRKAYQQGRVTTRKFAQFLEIPLYEAMERGREIRGIAQDEPTDTI
ncbi:ImmA/IrrE family metallo-endopeptidase [Candidatus Peregrinibacteria bacterium]|nr:ImmA/IrrE family metallo-endopeptidase [Candidatus Peregrinibacteria bacterium]